VNQFVLLVPVLAAAACALAFHQFNRRRGWFTVGETIFWSILLLIVLELVWLIWF
jgi:hypothetical protein